MNNFQQKKIEGRAAEDYIAEFLGQQYQIRRATDEEQRRGIDLIITTSDGTEHKIEVKVDFRAADTGNAFIETTSMEMRPISVGVAAALDTAKPGWAKTTQADILLYWVHGLGKVFVLLPGSLRAALGEWGERYRTRSVDNEFYRTIGIIVPLTELARISTEVFDLAPPRTSS